MVARADWHLPDPSNVEDYVRRCLAPEFLEENETRTYRSDPVFPSVLTPLNARQYTKAIEAAEPLLARFSDFDLVYDWLGSAYRSTQQLAKSREILSEGIWKVKRKCLLLTHMGETEWKLGDIHAAVYWWSQALHCLSLKPVDYNAYLLLASVAGGLGFDDLMRTLYTRVDSLKPGQVRLAPQEKNTLETLVRNNRTEALQKTLRGLQSKYGFSGPAEPSETPTDADTWNKKGVALDGLRRFEEAIKCYDKALEINPRHVKAWTNKGLALVALRRFEEAIQCLDKALEINPGYDKAWNPKGVALNALGRYAEAIQCYDRALEINPRFALAWYNKGVALKGLGRREEAIQCYDKALEINPQLDLARKERMLAAQMLPSQYQAGAAVAPADWHLPDPSNVEDYVRRCLAPEFLEVDETSTSQSKPELESVLVALRARQYSTVISLLIDMGESKWKSGDIHAAVYWWSQAVHCQWRKDVYHNAGGRPLDGACLFLASVAAGLGFDDLMRALCENADSIVGGRAMLFSKDKNELEALVRNNKTEALQKTLRGLQSKYFRRVTPERFAEFVKGYKSAIVYR
jgi:tetratricopeptide (TPR) repeat protein